MHRAIPRLGAHDSGMKTWAEASPAFAVRKENNMGKKLVAALLVALLIVVLAAACAPAATPTPSTGVGGETTVPTLPSGTTPTVSATVTVGGAGTATPSTLETPTP